MHNNSNCRSNGAVGQSVCPARGRSGVRIPAATDLSRKNRQSQLLCQTLGYGSVSRVLGDDNYKWISCHSRCGTLKKPFYSMAMSVEHRSKFSPSPVIVTSPYVLKTLEWDDKLLKRIHTLGDPARGGGGRVPLVLKF